MKRLLCHLFSYNNQPRCLPYDTYDHVISPNKFPLCVRCLLPLSWGLANKAFWVCDLFKGGFPGWSISLISHHPSPFYWMRHKKPASKSIVAWRTLIPSPVEISASVIASGNTLKLLIFLIYLCEKHHKPFASYMSHFYPVWCTYGVIISCKSSDMLSAAMKYCTVYIHQLFVHTWK